MDEALPERELRQAVAHEEIDAIRAMLAEKPRPVGWAERRARLDEVGSVSAVADDIRCEPVDCGGVPGEWSLAPGADPSRVLMSSTDPRLQLASPSRQPESQDTHQPPRPPEDNLLRLHSQTRT